MIVGFSIHGKGRAQGAINYLLSETGTGKALDYLLGETSRTGVPRTPLPQVVRGDPAVTQRLINSVPFTWRYTSGVLSFSTGEQITPAMEQKIIGEFETAAFAGLSPDRYNILWIRHAHTGREELHFITPRIELLTGKSLNIAPPGPASRAMFDTFRSKINAEFGLSDPDDPARRRGLSLPDFIAKLNTKSGKVRTADKLDVREAIDKWISAKIRSGAVTDRAGVVRELQAAGFNVPRQGKNYLTVVDPKSGGPVRLRGAHYEANWLAGPASSQVRPPRTDVRRMAALAKALEPMRQARAGHHLKRYGPAPAASVIPMEVYDRTGVPPIGSLETARNPAARTRTTIDPLRGRIDEASQRWNQAIRNFEFASDRFGRTDRTLADNFEQKIVACENRLEADRVFSKYLGVSTPLVSTRKRDQELEPEIEMEMERR